MSIKRKLFYFYNDVILKKMVNMKIESIENSIKYVIENKSSVARFGDGELNIINSRNIGFQSYDKELSERLREVLTSDIPNIAICVPGALKDMSDLNDEARSFWMENLRTGRASWYKYMKKNKIYYNTQMTRLYMDYKEKDKSEGWFRELKNIWNEREIVIIEGEKSRLGVGNDLFNNVKSISRILAPSENAFKSYHDILEEAKKVSKDKLILIALGPTATVLAFDLHKLGYQAIDIGHADIEYEWFLRKSTKKESIPGKYTNEALNRKVLYSDNNKSYENQIIARINI